MAQALRRLAALIIPASAGHALPGADDPAIFAEILDAAVPHASEVAAALAALDAIAGRPFEVLGAAGQVEAAGAFREQHPRQAALLESLVVRCYYRDERVMRSIGMEPRPPFPGGFEVEPSDLSLLEPVIARGKIWREPG
jgi:hypothetical protein